MGIGSVLARVVVDDPGRVRLGSQDTVTGSIVLTFLPGAGQQVTPELFAPLKITVLLQGRSKTKIWKSRGNHRTIYRGRVPLIHIGGVIHDGKCKLAAREAQSFPFVIHFPDGINMNTLGWDDDAAFRTEGRLPPTMSLSYNGFAHRFECFTEYNVSAAVNIPGIEVDVRKYNEMVPVLYGSASIPRESAIRDDKRVNSSLRVQNENLMLEAHRPQGFRQKAKAAFKSDFYPTWAAQVFCQTHQNVYLNEALSIAVSLKPSKDNTAEIEPIVILHTCHIEITAFTLVRAEALFHHPSSEGNDVVVSYAVANRQPFSKANDWSLIINTAPLKGLAETFTTHNISRGYTMKIALSFELAGKQEKIKFSMPIVVHPPIQGNLGVADEGEGSSSAAAAAAAAGTSNDGVLRAEQEQLPAYKPPPTYEDAVHSDDEEVSAEGSSAVDTVAEGVENLNLEQGKGKGKQVAT